MNYPIIQKSQLEGVCRLDAEYYQPIYLETVDNLLKVKNTLLGNIAQRITQGPNPVFVESGKSSLNGRNIKKLRVVIDNSNYVSGQEFNKYKNFKVKQNDILITLKGLGSIGKAGYVFQQIDAIFSRDIGLIRLNDSNLSKFIYAFLLSKYGSRQVERSSTGGTGQLTLATTALKQIIVPQLKDEDIKFIASLIENSEENYKQSNSFYRQAEDLLLEELGLKNLEIEGNLFFIVNASDAESAKRFDADYFQPKYDNLLEKIKQNNAQILTSVVENINMQFDPAKNPGKEFKYVELSDIDSAIGIIDGSSTLLGKEAPSRARRLLRIGDILVSSVEGSLDKVAFVDKAQEGYLASTGFFQLRSREILPEVILVLAKSIVLQWQLKRHCAGTILTAVPSESLQKMFVPTISKPIQEKIASLVRKSHKARKKSKEILEAAKRKVEEMIEKDGQNRIQKQPLNRLLQEIFRQEVFKEMKKCPKCNSEMVKIKRSLVVNLANPQSKLPESSDWWACNNCGCEEKV